MQTASSRFWSWVAESISYNDNYKQISIYKNYST